MQLSGCIVSWVPSHGKKLEWMPPHPYDADEIRSLNNAADTKASGVAEEIYKRDIEPHDGLHSDALLWANRQLKRLWEASDACCLVHLEGHAGSVFSDSRPMVADCIATDA